MGVALIVGASCGGVAVRSTGVSARDGVETPERPALTSFLLFLFSNALGLGSLALVMSVGELPVLDGSLTIAIGGVGATASASTADRADSSAAGSSSTLALPTASLKLAIASSMVEAL